MSRRKLLQRRCVRIQRWRPEMSLTGFGAAGVAAAHSCTLVTQLSRRNCTRGATYGCAENAVWVSGGCRGRFRCRGSSMPSELGMKEQLVACGDWRTGRDRCQCASGPRRRFDPWRSQGAQDAVARAIFAEIGAANRQFVEIGFNENTQCSGSGSNTCRLWLDGWRGLLLDGAHENASIGLRREMVTSQNVAAILRKYGVAREVDFVSIDVDSFEIWLLDALLRAGYRPRLVAVEFNANIPWEHALAFPDPAAFAVKEAPDRLQRAEHGEAKHNCFAGAAPRAFDMLAREHGYALVAVAEPPEPFHPPHMVGASSHGGHPPTQGSLHLAGGGAARPLHGAGSAAARRRARAGAGRRPPRPRARAVRDRLGAQPRHNLIFIPSTHAQVRDRLGAQRAVAARGLAVAHVGRGQRHDLRAGAPWPY